MKESYIKITTWTCDNTELNTLYMCRACESVVVGGWWPIALYTYAFYVWLKVESQVKTPLWIRIGAGLDTLDRDKK